MRRTPIPLAAAAFGLALVLALGAAVAAAGMIERRSAARVLAALQGAGEGWVEVAADGLQLRLSGTAETEARRFRALQIAAAVVDSARIVDAVAVAPAAPPPPPRYGLEILSNDEGVSLIGLVPAAAGDADVAARLARLVPALRIADMTERADHPAEPGWEAALGFGLSVVADLPRARVSIAADRVTVRAVSASPAEKRRLEADFARRAPPGLRLQLDIAAPRPVIAPFILRFVIDADGPRFDACSADDQAAADRILAAAVAAGALGRGACTIGLGVPSPAWGRAAAMAIAALAEMGEGTLTMADADVTLIAAHTVPAETFERVAGELKARLPDVFALRSQRLDAPVDEAAGAARRAPEFTAVLTAEGGVQLRGRLADERMRDAVEAFARIRFGADAVAVATRLDPEVPDGWPVRVLAGLDALGETVEGSLRVRPDLVELTGVTGNPEATDRLSRMLSERLGPGADFRLSLRYDRRFDPEAGLMPPSHCLGEIAAIQAAQKLTFAPGSAEIAPGARAAIDAIAEVLRGCGEIALEIAGHTDSQGRAEMNLRLSQARAEAVLAALAARRVPVANMVARGYGQDEPIADNRSEAGREANRRIEFRLRAGAAVPAPAVPAPAAPDGNRADGADGADGAGDAAAAEVSAAPPDEAPDGAPDGAPAEAAAAAPAEAASEPPAVEATAAAPADAPGAAADAPLAAVPVAVQTPAGDTPRPRPRPARN